MKKALFLVLALIMALTFVGCGNDDSLEAQLRQAKSASKAALESFDKSQKNYNDLLDDYENYRNSQDYLDSFK